MEPSIQPFKKVSLEQSESIRIGAPIQSVWDAVTDMSLISTNTIGSWYVRELPDNPGYGSVFEGRLAATGSPTFGVIVEYSPPNYFSFDKGRSRYDFALRSEGSHETTLDLKISNEKDMFILSMLLNAIGPKENINMLLGAIRNQSTRD